MINHKEITTAWLNQVVVHHRKADKILVEKVIILKKQSPQTQSSTPTAYLKFANILSLSSFSLSLL